MKPANQKARARIRPNNPNAAMALDIAYTVIESARRQGHITGIEALDIYQSLFVNAIAEIQSQEEAERFMPYLRAFKDAFDGKQGA